MDLNTVGILFALYTGVRLGELCAVQWKDINLEQRVCYIRHTLQRIQNPDRKSGEPKTCLHIGLPKNGKERIIPLHDHIVDLLRKIQEKYEPSDYLLSGDFRPTEPRTMENRFKESFENLWNPRSSFPCAASHICVTMYRPEWI